VQYINIYIYIYAKNNVTDIFDNYNLINDIISKLIQMNKHVTLNWSDYRHCRRPM